MSDKKSKEWESDPRDKREEDHGRPYEEDHAPLQIAGLVITGTSRNDTLTGFDGNDSIYGGAGNDVIDGGKGNDTLDGGSGNDRINAGAGNDTIIGGAGNDVIDGGAGLDVAVYSGKFSDYKLTLSLDGGHSGTNDDDRSAMTVHDLRPGSPDGVDVLKNVEILKFADGEYRDGHFYSNNTPATISGTASGSVVEAGGIGNAIPGLPSTGGTLTVVDPDPGQNVFQAPTTLTGSYGSFAFDPATGIWSYTLDAARSDLLAAGALAHDALTVQSLDGSASQVIDVTITGANDAPVVSAQSASAIEGGAAVSLNALATATDADSGTSLAVKSTGALPAGVSYDAASHSFTLDPTNAAYNSLAQGVHSSIVVNYTVTDGLADTNAAISFDLVGTNDAPVVTAQSASAIEGGAAVSLDALATATDADSGASLAVKSVGALPAGVSYKAANHSFTFDPANAAYNSLAQGVHNSVVVNYTVTDGLADTNATLTFDLVGTNDAPIVGAQVRTATEGGAAVAVDALALASDPDSGATLAVVVPASLPAGVSYDTNSHSFVLNPADPAFDTLAQAATRNVVVSYGVSDGIATTTGSITFTVTGTNDAPVAHPVTVAAVEGGAIVTVNALSAASDIDGGTLSIVGMPGNSSLLAQGLSYNAGNHVLTFNPTTAVYESLAQGEHQLVTVNFSVSDTYTSTPTSVSFDIVGTNDAPVLVTPTLTDLDTTLRDAFRIVTGQLSASDVDHGHVLAYSIAGAGTSSTYPEFDLQVSGTYGTLYLDSHSGNYQFVYNAALDALYTGVNGHDSFSVNVSDEHGASDSKTLTVNLTGTNDATVINGVMPFNYTVGDPAQIVAPGLWLTDADSDRVTSATVSISAGFSPANGDAIGFDATALPAGWTALQSGPLATDPWTITTSAGVITAAYDATAGVLNIQGTGDLATYSHLLDSVTFEATVAGAGPRTLSFVVADGTVESLPATTDNLSLLDLSTSVVRLPGISEFDSAGFSVSNAGDVNHDGYADLVVGAPWVNDLLGGTEGIGSSYIVYGKPSGMADATGELPLATISPANANGFSVSGIDAFDNIGFSVRAAGDLNGDGFGDVIIGSPYSDQNGAKAGLTYVVFGASANADVTDADLSGSVGFKILGANAGDYAGYSVSGAGDINGDGYADLIIGAPKVDLGQGSDSGGAYVLFGHGGAFDSLNLATNPLDGANGFAIGGVAAGDWTGASVASAGDVNGDGIADLIVGTATPLNTAASASAYVIFGDTAKSAIATDLTALDGANGFSIRNAGTNIPLTGFGRSHYAVRSAGDMNGDGFADIIVGAPYAATANGETGAAYVVYGKQGVFDASIDLSHLTPAQGFAIAGAQEGDRAGYAVSAAGDVNGDGYGDLIIGAPSAQQNGSPAGTSYVIFGGTDTSHIDLGNLGNAGFRISAAAPHNDSGYAVSAAGDVNGDGFADLLVASSAASPHGLYSAGESYVIFGAKFITTPNTQVGNGAPGTPTTFSPGSADADIFIAGQGDAVMVGNGGADSFSGGVGNDTMHIGAANSADSSFLKIDGGGGFNALVLDGSGMILDLTAPGVAGRIHNVDHIDLGGNGNTLVLDIHDVLNLSENGNRLQIEGGASDHVSVTGSTAWTDGGLVTLAGVSYHSYSSGLAQLLIDTDINQTQTFA